MPYEEISEEIYKKMISKLRPKEALHVKNKRVKMLDVDKDNQGSAFCDNEKCMMI